MNSSQKAYHAWGIFLVSVTIAQYIVSCGVGYQWGVIAPWVSLPLGTVTAILYIASLFERFSGKAHNYMFMTNIVYFGVSVLAFIIDFGLYLFSQEKYYCNLDADTQTCTYNANPLVYIWLSYLIIYPLWYLAIKRMIVYVLIKVEA